VLAASGTVWFVVRDTLYTQVDNRLKTGAQEITRGPQIQIEQTPDGRRYIELTRDILGSGGYIQIVSSDGSALRTFEETQALPVGQRALATAQSGRGTFFSDSKVGGTDVRVFTAPGTDQRGRSYAIQVAQSLTDVHRTLDRVTLFLILIAAGGIGIAAALGLLVSRAALAPVRRLTEASEKVAHTRDLSERIDAGGRDELSRLAASFNSMLGALEESTRAQRQLVADASHELRTPLTSLRTNIEVLATERKLPPGERQRLLSDVVEQLGEMTTLISELIELARGEQSPENLEDVRLDLLAADAVERTRRNRPGIEFKTDLSESLVHGVPRTIERAVANLLEPSGAHPAGRWRSRFATER
jgi:two-component system sensor histidine kinase MprB